MPTIVESSNNYPQFISFVSKINGCLTLLEKKSNSYRKWMDSHNLKVRPYPRSGANFADNAIDIGLQTFNSSETWLASVLVHETVHFLQYRAGRYKAGTVAETEANHHQLIVLKQIGGSKHEIAYLSKQKGDHFDINNDGKIDATDYLLRDY